MNELNCYLVKIVDTDISNKPIESGYFVKAKCKFDAVLTGLAIHSGSIDIHKCVGNTPSINVEDRIDDGTNNWIYIGDNLCI